MFGESKAEMTAKNNLVKNFPNSIIMNFDNIEFIKDYEAPIIYIGHSNDNGIMYGNHIIEWNYLADIIKESISDNHLILGCNSDIITSLTSQTGKKVISFDFEIDAIMGSNIIGLIVAQFYSMSSSIIVQFFRNLISRFFEISNNPEKALPMKLWGQEVNTLGIIGLRLFVTLFPTTGAIVAISIAKFAVALLGVAPAIFNLVNTIKMYIDGKNPDLGKVLSDLTKVIFTIGTLVKDIINGFPWYKQAAANAAFATDTVSNALASVAKILLLAASLGLIISSVTLFLWDFKDSDKYYW